MTVLITGGTKGIGLAIARRLAPIHGRVVLAYHSDQAAAQAAHAEIAALGASVETVRSEVGSPEGAAALMAEIERQGHGLSHIVHAAAMIYPTTLLGADLAKFRQAVETNGLSLLYLVHAAQGLLDRGSSVVFITSMGSRIPSPKYGALGVGKALAEAIVRYLVAELAPRGIRINGVAPGLVHTTSVAAMLGSEDAAQAAVDRAARTNPSGRESRDSDYAALVEFLLGPEAEFIQGQVIAATGGTGVIG
ncbi:MAG: SDR family oxidoreductase [Phenylobacterium sp.]|uniref:SDR family oxidoreductase n=1 Tax=Phenylobacterium sp. TaxID=1871053 RepID=UPI0027321FA0|nr:SDR family oxidoreductase [Phenylobacterium sp.]MDP2010426.1 SDR family oxidoreductase [Phenylobacterium sp.]